MRISASACRSACDTLVSGWVLSWIIAWVLLPIPSSVGPFWTVMPVFGMSVILGVLLGVAKMASARSLPTLRLSMSNAATIWISLGLYPAKMGLRSPVGFSAKMV